MAGIDTAMNSAGAAIDGYGPKSQISNEEEQ